MKLFSKKDVYIILILIVFTLSSSLFYIFKAKNEKYSNILEVYINGNLVMEIDKPGKYTVYNNGKRVTTIVFDGKKAKVINSICPLKLCEKLGWIKPGGEIICVPNKMVIKFKKSGIDAQTW